MKSFKTIKIAVLIISIFSSVTSVKAGVRESLYAMCGIVSDRPEWLNNPLEPAVMLLNRFLVGSAIGGIIGSGWAAYRTRNVQQDRQTLQGIIPTAERYGAINTNIDKLSSLKNSDKQLLKQKITAYNQALSIAGNSPKFPEKERIQKELIDAVRQVKPIDQETGITRGMACGCAYTALIALEHFLYAYYVEKR